MSKLIFKGFSISSIPKDRNFWMCVVLFGWVVLTGVLLLLHWHEATRWLIFRRIVQMILFSVWGIDRFNKYRTHKAQAEAI